MELLAPNQQAVNQVMTVFTEEQRKEFSLWLTTQNETPEKASRLIFGHSYFFLSLEEDLTSDEFPDLPEQARTVLKSLQAKYNENKTCYLINNFLIFVLNQQRRGKDITLILLPVDILASLLATKYAPEHFTPSEIRVLAQLISDPEIKHAAQEDDVQVSTKETHYKAAAAKIGARKRAGLIADLTALLLLEITVASAPHPETPYKSINEYREKYLPSAVRLITLTSESGESHKFLDMGPKSGKIIIVLHPMILPDIREQEIHTLSKQGIRLIWPLRHGFLHPKAKPLNVELQLKDTITSIELAREQFCDDPFILAAMITSGWYAIRYAEQFPQNLECILFAGGCYRRNQNKTLSRTRQFGQGLIALAANNPTTTNYVFNFAEKHFSQHQKFRDLLESLFSDSPSDLKILRQEMSRPGFEGRFFYSLKNSFRSLRHDFLHQSDMGWSRLNQIPVPIHFAHGNDNAVTTEADITHLASTIAGSKLHIMKDCGQLMYYEHFEVLAKIVASLERK